MFLDANQFDLDNPDADRKSYFYIASGRFFLTGDVGVLDDEGFLFLKGRSKELIKKGGEQVSPYEVEELLLKHGWIQTAICFSVPSEIYGEEVGCALVLSSQAPNDVELSEVIVALRLLLKNEQLAQLKFPVGPVPRSLTQSLPRSRPPINHFRPNGSSSVTTFSRRLRLKSISASVSQPC